jgi:arginase
MKIAIIALPYSTDTDAGTAEGPDALLHAGLIDRLRERGDDIAGPFRARLTPDEAAAYGAWNRIALADAHLARLTSEAVDRGAFPVVLESNCYGAIGVLAGLQKSTGTAPPRLGMVWVDAHGDCNTPDTSPSGMLSGMPVAISAGLCLERLRRQAGLETPIAPRDIVMVCVRANDPLEQELIDRSGIENIAVYDIRGDQAGLAAVLARLSEDVDRLYVHLDVDALDESEVASMWLTAPGGPTTGELARALGTIMATPKVAAFGIADINPLRDLDGRMVGSALTLLIAGIEGLARARG